MKSLISIFCAFSLPKLRGMRFNVCLPPLDDIYFAELLLAMNRFHFPYPRRVGGAALVTIRGEDLVSEDLFGT